MNRARIGFSYWGLLAAQLSMLLVAPLSEQAGALRVLTEIAFGLMLLFSVWSVSHDRRTTLIAGGIAMASFVTTQFAHAGIGPPVLSASANVLAAAAFAYVSGVICRDVFLAPRVSSHTVVGAICVYLLLGMVFGFLYSALSTLQPRAFSFAPNGINASDHIYFSMVTLTTLGYGDYTPLSPLARGLIVVEAVSGQVYLTVLLARLVALHVAHNRGRD